ncbi:MAG: UDP-N-acetylmuramate dehydrogenase [Lentisphaerae bacterium]|nr:UDP-N-acetylmuramate dehydrogenase [Lentisphaerota bacterium]
MSERADQDDDDFARIDDCLARAGSRVHLVGIGGVGMAGLALLLKQRGYTVSGCDAAPGPLATSIAQQQINVCRGHDPQHLARGTDWVVTSTAVPSATPELERARVLGLPVFRRGHVLARVAAAYPTIVVCGTHGKTTTAVFIAQMLRAAGESTAWCIGGESKLLGAVASAGQGRSPWMVIEADESDGTLAGYHPAVTVVTGIEYDHAEYFADRTMLMDCFRQVADQTRDRLIFCAEDPGAIELAAGRASVTAYGVADAERLGVSALATAPGDHNMLNAIAAATVGEWAGLAPDQIAAGLATRQLPARRMECVSAAGGVRVISDYAHHPSEIRALVRTARQMTSGRLLAVFQPHRYSRTYRLGSDFPAAFVGVDDLVITPVYAASEPVCPGGRMWSLYRHFRDSGEVLVPRLADTLERAWYHLQRAAQPGDTLLVIGAGDVERVAHWAKDAGGCWGADAAQSPAGRPAILERDVRLGPRTTFGVGGRAEYWGRVTSPEELSEVLAWCSRHAIGFRMLGGGSNVLIGDCGVPGVVVRLDGIPFSMVTGVEDGVEVGPAVPLARLVAKAERCGYGDYSFLEGIPGTVGGALGMNAGAHGESISERIKLIHCLNPDGTPCIVQGSDLEVGYRTGGMKGRVVVKALLRRGPRTPEESARMRAEFAERRVWMKGLQSAGSIFKNPPNDHAGRLIEEAGMKEVSIGGATVSQRHGNLITASSRATASDVRALLETVRERVEARSGVRLETEVELW